MSKKTNEGADDSGQSTGAEPVSAEEKAALAAFDDDTTWDDGEEVESRFEAKDEDDSEATDEDEAEVEDSEDDGESEDDADDADSEEADDESADDDENDQDSEDSDDEDGADTTDATLEAERKRHNDEMAQARIAEKKARDALEAERKQREEASIEDYLKEAGDDDNERKRRENNVEQYRIQEDRVALNDEKLRAGIERAVVQVELFRTGSDAIKEELASALDDFEQKFVVFDKNNRPLQIKIDPETGKQADVVTYLQRKADRIKRLTGDSAEKKAKSKKKESSRTLTPPTRAPKKAKVDADLESFDEEARR